MRKSIACILAVVLVFSSFCQEIYASYDSDTDSLYQTALGYQNIYYQNNFNYSDVGMEEWQNIWGGWQYWTPDPDISKQKIYDFESGVAEWNPSSGASWSVITAGTGNRIYRQASTSGTPRSVVGEDSWTDYIFECDFTPTFDIGNVSGGINFGFRNYNGSRYNIYLDGQLAKLQYEGDKASAGCPLMQGRIYHSKIIVSGTSVEFYLDGKIILSTTLAGCTQGKVDIGNWHGSTDFDNVVVSPLTQYGYKGRYAQLNSAGGTSVIGSGDWDSYWVADVIPMSIADGNATVGIDFRYQNEDNRYYVCLSGNSIKLIRIQNGFRMVLNSSAITLNMDTRYTIKINGNKSIMDVYFNETKKFTVTDGTFSKGKAGISCENATAYISNMQINQIRTVANEFTSTGNKTYYVSNSIGNDQNNGLSEATPWKSMAKVTAAKFAPGDRILLKAGDVWDELVILRGKATKENPIILSSYGTGDKPLIRGWANKIMAGINLAGWEIRGIHVQSTCKLIMNDYDNVSVAMNLSYNTPEILNYLKIENCTISGAGYNYRSRGLQLYARTLATRTTPSIQDVQILNNEIYGTGWHTILLSGLDSTNNAEWRQPTQYKNVKIVGNTWRDYGGQGCVIQGAYDSIAERNVSYNGGQYDKGGVAWGPGALWCIGSKNIVFRFNEIWGMKDSGSNADGSGVNIDWANTDISILYNYVHDNMGPGITTMANHKGKIMYNRVIGNNKNEVVPGTWSGMIKISDFNGRPDLLSGVKNLEVSHNLIKVDHADTSAISCGVSDYVDPWVGNKIMNNRIVMSDIVDTKVFKYGENATVDISENNYISLTGTKQAAAVKSDVSYNWNAWQALGYDQNTNVATASSQIPGEPSNIFAVINPGNGILLKWDPPLGSGNGIDHYNIYRGTEENIEVKYKNMMGQSTITEFRDNDEYYPVDLNTTYYYKIQAEDKDGNLGNPVTLKVDKDSLHMIDVKAFSYNQESTKVNVSAKLRAFNENAVRDCTLIFGLYQGNRLLDVYTKQINELEYLNYETYQTSFDIELNSGEYIVKMFLWKSLSSRIPIKH